jgi:cytochrome c553
MKKLSLAICMILASGLVHAEGQPAAATPAADPQAGKEKATTICAACHGPEGVGIAPTFPNLAGQHAGYIAAQLAAFKAGKRQDPSMTAMVAPLSDQDMANLAAYYAAQKPHLGKADKALAEAGEKIYRGGNLKTGVAACMACHGPTGMGNPLAGYPMVRGQPVAYTVKQLEDFKAGKRSHNAAGMFMQDVASRLSADEIKAVAEYMAGLH